MKKIKRIGLKGKFIFGLTIMGILITVAVVYVGISTYRNAIIKQYNDTAYMTAAAVESYFTDEDFEYYIGLVERYKKGEITDDEMIVITSNERYQEKQRLISILRESMNAFDINVSVFDIELLENYDAEADANYEWNPMFYIFDSYHQSEMQLPFGYCGSVFPDYCQPIIDAYYSGERVEDYFVYDGEYGYTTSAVYPVVRDGKTIAFVGVDIPMSTLQADTHRFVIRIMIAAGATATILLVLGILFLVRTMIYPIKLVASEAERFVKDNNAISENLEKIKTGDEIQVLSENLLKLEVDINEYIENLTKVTAEKERIGAELNVATQIQADMLPSIFPAFPERKDFDIYATMTPAKEVGGDFYDFFLVDENHLAIVMADVAGKGVPAALFMVIAKTLIKNRTQMLAESGNDYSPAKVLAYVNEQLCEGNEADMFVTVWLCILDLRTGKGIVSNAGHEYPTIRRAGGEFELIKTRHSPAVAAMEGMRFREHEIELNPGDSLYVYTDGVPEATNSNDELFGTERMLQALNENPSDSAEELLNRVKDHIDTFVGEAPQFDDITMLCMNYFGRGDESDA